MNSSPDFIQNMTTNAHFLGPGSCLEPHCILWSGRFSLLLQSEIDLQSLDTFKEKVGFVSFRRYRVKYSGLSHQEIWGSCLSSLTVGYPRRHFIYRDPSLHHLLNDGVGNMKGFQTFYHQGKYLIVFFLP